LHANFILLGVSAFLCALDLICYASRKKENPDEEPERPTGKWALVDLIMAILLQFAFWTSLVDLSEFYRYDYYSVLGLYGILADLICSWVTLLPTYGIILTDSFFSILHAWCFWKQLMDDKKQNWLSKLEKQPCARCGYTEEENNPPTPDHRHDGDRANIFPYVGPSADLGRTTVLTPESPESAMEEGLLIGSDFGSDYGSVKRIEPVLEPPEEIVVGKGKKKVRSGSSQKGSAKEST
jgi:hypothetical protein